MNLSYRLFIVQTNSAKLYFVKLVNGTMSRLAKQKLQIEKKEKKVSALALSDSSIVKIRQSTTPPLGFLADVFTAFKTFTRN